MTGIVQGPPPGGPPNRSHFQIHIYVSPSIDVADAVERFSEALSVVFAPPPKFEWSFHQNDPVSRLSFRFQVPNPDAEHLSAMMYGELSVQGFGGSWTVRRDEHIQIDSQTDWVEDGSE